MKTIAYLIGTAPLFGVVAVVGIFEAGTSRSRGTAASPAAPITDINWEALIPKEWDPSSATEI